MADRIFVDTNVLVYSRDTSESQKQPIAMDWMKHLWNIRSGRLSYQVLQEYYVTVTEKLRPGLDKESARRELRTFFSWRPIPVDNRIMEGAWNVQDKHKLSWWDALIVSTAQISDCSYLLSEDFQEGMKFGNLTVINPFHTSPSIFAT